MKFSSVQFSSVQFGSCADGLVDLKVIVIAMSESMSGSLLAMVVQSRPGLGDPLM